MTEERPDPKAYAMSLMAKNRSRIARAVTRQVRSLVPRYRTVDIEAHERNAELLIGMLENLLGDGDETAFAKTLTDIVQLRSAVGFTTTDFVVASHCFMPVIRRFFVERSSDLRLANDAYEELEERTLALIGRLVAMVLTDHGEGDDTAPNRVSSITDEAPWLSEPISIETV